jgi:hypothetical protein
MITSLATNSFREQEPVTMFSNIHSAEVYEGPFESNGDVHLRYGFYTYQAERGLVSAGILSVMFTLDRPPKDVWPYLKDFNLWQNSGDYYYSGVVGDMADEPFTLTIGKKDDPGRRELNGYKLLRVIPHHLILLSDPVPTDGSTGGVSPGIHPFVLTELNGNTVITLESDHAQVTQNASADEALATWRQLGSKVFPIWRDKFIPTLRKLVRDDPSGFRK